jgi:C-5 cytosine-specific DNA methylase
VCPARRASPSGGGRESGGGVDGRASRTRHRGPRSPRSPAEARCAHGRAHPGIPGSWEFAGGKTARYRQAGNAFPPPVAAAVGESVRIALAAGHRPAQQRDKERSVWTHRAPAAIVQERLFLPATIR